MQSAGHSDAYLHIGMILDAAEQSGVLTSMSLVRSLKCSKVLEWGIKSLNYFLLCSYYHQCIFSMFSYLQNSMSQCQHLKCYATWAQNATSLRWKYIVFSHMDIQVQNMEELEVAGLPTNYLQGFYYSLMADMAHLIIVHCSAQSKSLYCIETLHSWEVFTHPYSSIFDKLVLHLKILIKFLWNIH